jgi:hypothetical protein
MVSDELARHEMSGEAAPVSKGERGGDDLAAGRLSQAS